MPKDRSNPLSNYFQQCRDLEDLCRVAPSPDLQEKIHSHLEAMNLIPQPQLAAAAAEPTKGKRKAAK
ncbi:MAG TPA: hypothetical protein VFM63_12040, partial [Pyrinomonadaceae bacterium]|nr:hypothetical protein [Pyrinomonadaceae bacterium]